MSKILSVALFLFSTSVFAKDNIRISQDWCDDGNFRVVIQGIGPSLPQGDNCTNLTGSTASSENIRVNEKSETPFGNSINFVLTMMNYSGTYRLFSMPQSKDYVIKSGTCGSNKIFVVEDVKRANFPHIPPESTRLAASQCQFDGVANQLTVSSDVDLSGVYNRKDDTSIDDFADSLL